MKTEIGLRHIVATENFGLWETGCWKRYFLRFSIFQVLTEFYDVEFFDSKIAAFFAYFFWIKRIL